MNKLALVAALVVAAGAVHAQPSAPSPSGPAPTGLVVGSGNFYSPIVANLEQAVAFYRGVGFELQGEPANADANLPLRQMFGLPDAKLRYQIGRAPGIPGGVEIIEISGAGGQRLDLEVQDPGAVMLQVVVRDLDATLTRLKAIKAPVVTPGGNPVTIPGLRAVTVQDPDGHFIRLVQPDAAAAQPGTGDIRAVRVRHTVENLDRAVALYRDELGLQETRAAPAGYATSKPIVDSMGLPQDTQWRLAQLAVPTSGIPLEIIEFKGARRPEPPPDLADPGATRIQLRVANIDAAAAALVKAGGTFISTGGKPLDLPAGNRSLKVGVVRDPDGFFIVLIDTPPSQ
ncbi:MAG TPA: VOC family protein [Casimicrobiaceae bacterium]|nr:VOC family protein [Casimicrobiaceae bacterium]